VTGPVERFAGQIASQGYVVGQQVNFSYLVKVADTMAACPSIYHEFEGPDPIAYDVEGEQTCIAVYLAEY
jgi:carboxymethylenebutenolidase